MYNVFEKITGSIEDKKEYKLYKKRIEKLPNDYKNAMNGIEKYMMNFGNGNMKFMKTLYGMLEMFEESVVEKKKVSDIIGSDISAFCEDVLKSSPDITWENDYKKKIQNKINKKFGN